MSIACVSRRLMRKQFLPFLQWSSILANMPIVRLLRAVWMFASIFLAYSLFFLVRRAVASGGQIAEPEVLAWLTRRRRSLDEKTAERLYRELLKLGGVYIKLGQVLSVMRGAIPEAISTRLRELQDRVPPRPFWQIQQVLAEDLGDAAGALSLEQQPIAAASLGQVHLGQAEGVGRIAVKVQYPDTQRLMAIDLRVVYWCMQVYRIFFPVRHLNRAYSSLRNLLNREANYVREAASMRRMAENFEDAKDYVFPLPLESWCTERVLPMTYIEGSTLLEALEVEPTAEKARWVVTALANAFFKQVFQDRVVHADPHPGNFLLVESEGRMQLGLLDFGAVCTLSDDTVDGLLQVLTGALTKRSDLLLEGAQQIGFFPQGEDSTKIKSVFLGAYERLSTLKDWSPATLLAVDPDKYRIALQAELGDVSLRELARTLQYPRDWFCLERASVLMFWLCAHVDPSVDILRLGMPYMVAGLRAARTRQAHA